MNKYFYTLTSVLCTLQMLVLLCNCNEFMFLSKLGGIHSKLKPNVKPYSFEDYTRLPWIPKSPIRQRYSEDPKDSHLKVKIGNLLNQTMIDTQNRIKNIDSVKSSLREDAPYKVGFILCMIQKSKDVMDELYSVAVKHKEQWKSLQHLKVFELIVHTNVDSTNLLRQLVEVHVNHLNSTQRN